LPSHWREMDDHQNVELVDLPMPTGTNAAAPVERDKIPLNNVVAAVMGAFKRRSLHYENGPPGNEQPEEPQIEKSDGKSKQPKRKKRRLRNIEAEEADRVVSIFEKGGLHDIASPASSACRIAACGASAITHCFPNAP